jgi:flavin-binding protein dodecin
VLPLPNLEEIQQQLLELPGIVRAYEERTGDFADQARAWMVRLEEALKNNQLPAAGAIAALRAMVISAERGTLPPGLAFVGTPTVRKARDAAASEAIRRAEETVSGVLRADLAQVDEARRLVRQMLAVAQRKGLPVTTRDAPSISDAINGLWAACLRDAELAAAATRVNGLVGPFNALVLLSRELPPQ